MTIPLLIVLPTPIPLVAAIRQQQPSRGNWAWVVYERRLAGAPRPACASSSYVDLDAK